MKTMNTDEVLELFREHVAAVGGQAEWARQHGITRQYVNQVVAGQKPGPPMLRALGLVRREVYVPVEQATDAGE
jgi:L-lactate utilization protein LutB